MQEIVKLDSIESLSLLNTHDSKIAIKVMY
jgi:hypothetical protein